MTPSLTQCLQKMDRDLEELLGQLSAFDNDVLNRRPADGGWSVMQVMHHLMLAEEGSLRYVKKKLSFDPKLQDAGMQSWVRQFLLRFYLGLPLKFKAPKGVGDDVLPERSDFREAAQRWKASRKDMQDYLAGLPEGLYSKSVYRHPFAGRMSLEGMARFFDGHFERHRKQIERVVAEVSA
ncbi:MAG: DinB family protein [Phaeodactylibacter sp.]|nr:DinB family protein [Phaeodactylibacter sp.]MCB9276890.1 DinB family protein [Lewinellaceae bacterium]